MSAVTPQDRGRDWIQGNRIPFDSGRIEVDRSNHGERSWWNVRRAVVGELCKVDAKRNRSQQNPVTFYENQRHVQPCRSELNFTNRSSRSARWASYCKFFPLPSPPPYFHRLHEKSTFTLLYVSLVVFGVEFSMPRRNKLAEPFNILLLVSRRNECYLQMINDTKGEIGNLLP